VVLKISQVLKYKGSITLLKFNMSRMATELEAPEGGQKVEALANQFGDKSSKN
jgi:hypothetical protein